VRAVEARIRDGVSQVSASPLVFGGVVTVSNNGRLKSAERVFHVGGFHEDVSRCGCVKWAEANEIAEAAIAAGAEAAVFPCHA